ncbi:MAG: AAA family ATPase [Pyrinomonadaceae bacterium]
MHISKVELENIKSHASTTFDFSPGTTAITGENGAGKTTIIEAIAWALFDVLEYKKDEFVRRGAQKGSVRVTFESGLDEREYQVYRDTATGYYVYDPAIQTRIANKKEEVTRFLWQHLGLEPGTDLRALFREAVGVPQGTLTAVFLATPTERKATFDRLLKVEEYRQAAEKLRETARYVEQQITIVDLAIARAEGELAREDAVADELRSVRATREDLVERIAQLESSAAEAAGRIKELDLQEQKIAELSAAAESARAERQKAELLLAQCQNELDQSRAAAAEIESVRRDSARHVEALGRLKELERERGERDRLRDELQKVERAEALVRADEKRVGSELDAAQKARAAIADLKPLVPEQARLEREVERLRDELARARAVEGQIRSLDERLGRLRDAYRANQIELRETEARSAAAARLADLETRDAALVRRLAELRATLERDERLQSEIRDGLCPILAERCRNLDNGRTLEGFIREQFAELRSQIGTLEVEHAGIASELKAARAADRHSKALETLRRRESELSGEGKCLRDERAALERQLADIAALEADLAAAEAELARLDSPRTHIEFYERQAAAEPRLREELSAVEKNLERLESDRRILVEQIDVYKDLDEQWTRLTAERDATAAAHRTFIANERLAAALAEREAKQNEARERLASCESSFERASRSLADECANYDRDAHARARVELADLSSQIASASATLEITNAREGQLSGELSRLTELRASLRGEYAQKERLERTAETTAFIRDTLREAAPRVAKNYVHFVSLEANQLYREISGKLEQSLEWSEDYGIFIDEEGFKRPFVSLSGGEQMAAALAVRLAILKQLSDIRIAFFDEPTTNMDAARRENLAQEISRIKNFDQLFVISHDDTFEGYVDQTVRVSEPAA